MTESPHFHTHKCYCGHVRHMGKNKDGLCLAKGCFCLIYRPRPAKATTFGEDET